MSAISVSSRALAWPTTPRPSALTVIFGRGPALVASLPLVSVVLFELLRVRQGEPAKHAGEGDRDAEQMVPRQVGSDGPLPEQFVT